MARPARPYVGVNKRSSPSQSHACATVAGHADRLAHEIDKGAPREALQAHLPFACPNCAEGGTHKRDRLYLLPTPQ
eukprot:354629-Chlamydomonas_euryale.AAC.4